jgi:oxygen-independent coproporphyrinogen-3 oxidase
MAGIYIHIPFCKSRCIYCGFYSTTSLALRQQYTDALCREAEARGNAKVSTLYFGGGTPSQLTIRQLQQLTDTIYKFNKVSEDVEVTIEVNPDDVNANFANSLRTLPVNRVSMGVQTFDDNRLRWLHRRHTSAQVGEAVERLRAAGIGNISIDLMYGFPEETLNEWERDITEAMALQPEHLSAYCLMIEEGTPLHRMHTNPIDEEKERQMYEVLMDRMEAAGYVHYEISNFAREGFRSRHNSSYWDGTPYVGLGAAAHSFDGQRRRSWNVSNIELYIESMMHSERLYEEEVLDDDTRYNDLVTVALRTREGLDLAQLSEKHKNYCMKNARRFLDGGLIQLQQQQSIHSSLPTLHLSLTRRGLFVSDMIMSELMWV